MKRFLDIIISLIGLLLLAIPFLLIMVLVRLDSQGAPIYWSVRVGRNGQNFAMPKFRTMKITTPEVPSNNLQYPHQHITSVGKFLRKYSIDELPQLYSVLIGEMSLVGPRPMIPQLSEINDQRARSGVDTLRPGITGWAQINGRDELSNKEKLVLDEEYLRRSSIAFDAKILCLTVVYVLKSKGVWH